MGKKNVMTAVANGQPITKEKKERKPRAAKEDLAFMERLPMAEDSIKPMLAKFQLLNQQVEDAKRNTATRAKDAAKIRKELLKKLEFYPAGRIADAKAEYAAANHTDAVPPVAEDQADEMPCAE